MEERETGERWELVHKAAHEGDRTERRAVPGGWLYRVVYRDHGHHLLAVTFVPVPAPEVRRG